MNSETKQQPVDRSASDYIPISIKYVIEITDKIPNIEEHLKIVQKCPAHLCIFESKKSIDAYVTIDNYQKVLKILYNRLFRPQNDKTPSITSVGGIDQMPIEKCLDSISITESQKLKEGWLDSIIGSSESKIENQGNKLWNKLIPPNIKETLESELQSDNDKIKDVWIFCEEENIDYPWEGLYWKDFYWGDRFRIVRIPEGRIPENYEAEDPNFKIEEVNILLDENSHPARRDRKCLRDLRIVDREIKLNDPNAQNNLKASDCIHIAADIEQFIHATSLLNALKVSKNIKFLFLYLYSSPQTKLIDEQFFELSVDIFCL